MRAAHLCGVRARDGDVAPVGGRFGAKTPGAILVHPAHKPKDTPRILCGGAAPPARVRVALRAVVCTVCERGQPLPFQLLFAFLLAVRVLAGIHTTLPSATASKE